LPSMKATIVLDEKTEMELAELGKSANVSRSSLVREAVNEFYLKEKRARENILFFVEQYAAGVLTKDTLLLLLPRKDAEAIIVGAATGKEAAELVKGSR
jgi:predicted transcriptional regulator